MNSRTVSWIARALGACGFAAIVAACAAPVATESDMTSEEAVAQGCSNDNVYVVCPSAGAFGTSTFERGLAALGCSGKVVEEGYGPGHSAIYQTRCSLSAAATFPCGTRCVWTRDGDRVCTPVNATGNVNQLIACTKGTPDLDAASTSTSGCGCSLPAPAGDTYVLWDPTCSSGGCITRFL